MEEKVMAIMRKNNLYPSFPSLVSDLFNDDFFDWASLQGRNLAFPATNVRETDAEFTIDMAVPGMRKEDFKINVSNGILTISSEKKEEKDSDGDDGRFSRKEFSYQSFQRSFSLPENVLESDKIQAKYTDGILCITLPKKEEARQRPVLSREIAVS